MEKFKFKPYNSSIDAGVFTMGNGYFESSGEADTRKQLSYPLSNIADYINDEVVPNVNENINSIGELDENVKKSIQELRTDVKTTTDSLKNEFDTCKNDVSLLNGRVDTVTSLPSGSTTGDAELADIRVGANGTTYPNAGGAVRGQINELKGDLAEVTGEIKLNIFENESDWEVGWINNNGKNETATYAIRTINSINVGTRGNIVINKNTENVRGDVRLLWYDDKDVFMGFDIIKKDDIDSKNVYKVRYPKLRITYTYGNLLGVSHFLYSYYSYTINRDFLDDETNNLLNEIPLTDKKIKDATSTLIYGRKFLPTLSASYDNAGGNYTYANDVLSVWKKLGIENVTFCVYLDGTNCTTSTNLSILTSVIEKADTMFNVSSIKFHCTISSLATNTDYQANYKNSIISVLDSIGTYFDNVYVLNERNDVTSKSSNIEFVSDLVSTIKKMGYKVGIPFASTNQLVDFSWNRKDIFNLLDIISCNIYLYMSSKKERATYRESLSAWDYELGVMNYFSNEYPDKKIVITETGVLPYEEFLAYSAQYDTTGLTHSDERVLKKYFYGLFENTLSNSLDEVNLWFVRELGDKRSSISNYCNIDNLSAFFKSYIGDGTNE